MTLENFRRIDMKLDKANEFIPDNHFAKEGDYNGINLVVQVTDDGLVKDQSGIQLLFKWKHNQLGNSGEKYFDEMDITQGLFEVNYPTQMLFAGKVTATIDVVENGTIIPTRNFTLTVEKDPINENSIVVENDFSILQEALLKANDWNARFDKVEADYINEAERVEAQYPVELAEVNEQLAHTTLTSLNGDNVVSMTAHPRIAPENSDSGRFQRAVNESPAGTIIFLADKAVYEITQSLIVDKELIFIGYGATLKALTQGLDNIINATNSPNFKALGIKFDQSLIGRTSINLTNCPDFLIAFCEFTGYSKEYGYYETDGGIRVSQTLKGRIIFNKWKDHGYQYENSDLNRCITIQANTDDILLMGNVFENVNQAVVIDGGSHIILANKFENVKDNSLYLLNVDKVIVANNNFDDKYDECIVLNGKTINIGGNSFKDSPNKFIAINGDVDTLIIGGNDFETTEGVNGKFISWRDASYTVKVLKANGNTFKNSMTTVDDINKEYFEIGNVENIDFSDNVVDVATGEFQRMLYFKGSKANGKVVGNTLQGTVESSKTIDVAASVTSGNILYDDNVHTLCRGIYSERITVRNQEVITSIGPYIYGRSKRQEVYMQTVPTKGTWKKADVCWNIGNDFNVLCWRRMTDGSSNVLNVDWKEIKTATV